MIRRSPKSRRFRRGFTLIETALATVIVGVGFVAVLQLLTTGTVVNAEATSLTTGMNLARGLNEYMLQKKYDDLPGFDGAVYKPAKDSRGHDLSEMADWKQTISVTSVDPKDLTKPLTDPSPEALRITVTVSHNGNQVCDLTWYALSAKP